ncbi:PspC domain-containing protein [Cryobacterium sp. SO2]|uniref:PspC domain-containing protein n=1 Tax=Cryobacterium sp. SO2 TaxID=1897060 RepID=UPI00223C96AB|nr:PspC domain-containing protein [Cryobacterium sp. SO2]WEO78870.1 PspC domain-containing protein [Cryobacterium sp. SO2]
MTETPSTTTPGSPYSAPGATGQPKPPGGAAFFDWVRGLGFVRGRDRWLAGVCGAVATRTGLDPLIVRGIAVVIAILGGPIFFLYAVGWALMPDESGRSLVEQAARQVFEPAMIAVGALLFFTFIPWMQGIWWQGPPEVWGMPGWLEVLLRTSWAIGLTAGIIVLVIYIAKRVPSPRNPSAGGYAGYASQSDPSQPSAAQPTAAAQPTTVAQPTTADEASTAAYPTPTTPYVPPVPPVPEPPADTAPTASTARQTEHGARTGPSVWDDLTGPATPAAAFDPQRYRTLHRRKQLGAGFISVVAGVALSAGAVAASFMADGSWSNSAFLVGAATALAVIALGIVVAGIRGKEGGWLNFFSIVLAVAMAWTAFIPAETDVATFGDPTWQFSSSSPTGFAMIAGAPLIDLSDVDTAPSGIDRTIDVWTAFGDVELLLPDNRTVAVEASSLAGGINYNGLGNETLDRGGVLFHDSRLVAEGSGTGVTTVRVWTVFGQVTINQPALR